MTASLKDRTLDFAHPYSTLATFLHFCLSAVGSPPGSVFDSKNHPKINKKSLKKTIKKQSQNRRRKRYPKKRSGEALGPLPASLWDPPGLPFGDQNPPRIHTLATLCSERSPKRAQEGSRTPQGRLWGRFCINFSMPRGSPMCAFASHLCPRNRKIETDMFQTVPS